MTVGMLTVLRVWNRNDEACEVIARFLMFISMPSILLSTLLVNYVRLFVSDRLMKGSIVTELGLIVGMGAGGVVTALIVADVEVGIVVILL